MCYVCFVTHADTVSHQVLFQTLTNDKRRAVSKYRHDCPGQSQRGRVHHLNCANNEASSDPCSYRMDGHTENNLANKQQLFEDILKIFSEYSNPQRMMLQKLELNCWWSVYLFHIGKELCDIIQQRNQIRETAEPQLHLLCLNLRLLFKNMHNVSTISTENVL